MNRYDIEKTSCSTMEQIDNSHLHMFQRRSLPTMGQSSYSPETQPIPGERRCAFVKDKPVLCDEPGCDKTFYYRHSMLRHKTLKHGRTVQPRPRTGMNLMAPPPGFMIDSSNRMVPRVQTSPTPRQSAPQQFSNMQADNNQSVGFQGDVISLAEGQRPFRGFEEGDGMSGMGSEGGNKEQEEFENGSDEEDEEV